MINCLIIYVFRFNLLQNHCKNNEYYCEIPYLRPRNPRAVALNAMLILLDPAHGHNTPGKFCELRDFAYGQNLCVLYAKFPPPKAKRLQLVYAPLIPTGEE